MDKFKKEELMNKIAHTLDITPQMYNESMSAVRGLSAYIKNQINNVEIYKQGSFRLGTIVRPYYKDKDGEFDIDLVVQFQASKNNIKPSIIKQALRSCLSSQNYRNLLEEEKRRCWTLHYPSNTCSFHVDLLPCVDESLEVKNSIAPVQYRNTSIAITEIEDKKTKPYNYKWMTSNPKGYAEWFDDINQRVYGEIKKQDRLRVLNENITMFDSIDSVSDEYTRTPLQQVIQILKRHRDVMYCNDSDNAPISIIITTLVGKIVEENPKVYNTTYDLLNFVIEGLNFYSQLTIGGITTDFSEDFKTKKLITKNMQNGKPYWCIKNPANSQENLVNKWNENPEKATEFFKWVRQVKSDLIDILDFEPEQIKQKLKYCLGERISNQVLYDFNFNNIDSSKSRTLNFSDSTPKPYRW